MLDVVLEHPQPVGLPDLVARLGVSKQAAHRRLEQLERQGLVLRGHIKDRFSIGPRLSALALATMLSRNQGAPVRAVLQDIVDDVGESCGIGVLDGLEYVFLERVECERPLRTHVDVGSRVQAHCLSGGKMMLAQLDAASLKRLLEGRKLEASTAKTITRHAALEAELAKTRDRGFALSNQEFMLGVVGVAVPITDGGRRVVAALVMHGPVTRLSLKACKAHVPRLMKAARRIGRVWLEDARRESGGALRDRTPGPPRRP